MALIGEGTYPHQFGGVSVWCDQLVRGMADYDFHVVALVATGSEQVRWELPDNVRAVTSIPLWGPPAPSRRPSRAERRVVVPLVERLVDCLLAPPEEGQDEFAALLRELAGAGERGSLGGCVDSDEAVGHLAAAWRAERTERGLPEMSLHDAVMAMRLLEHSLRPLSSPPLRVDICHTVTNGVGILPALATKWRHGTPIVLTEHGVYLREQYLHSAGTPYRWPVKSFFLSFARRLCSLGYHEAAVVAPGNAYNRRWEEELGAPAQRIRTVYNGVDPASFPAADGEPEVPTISWAGRVDPIKDLETLLRAFALVRDELPDARLRIFGGVPPGGAPYLERCRRLSAELGVEGAASFEGRVDDIRDAYVAGQVVVLCSISEGFPYTLIEAMTCGRPCVATDVGGVAEAVGDTGLVVPPRNERALARACLFLLHDPALRRRLGAAARARALGQFTLDQALTAYDEMYAFLGRGYALPSAPTDAGTGTGPVLVPPIGAPLALTEPPLGDPPPAAPPVAHGLHLLGDEAAR